MIRMSGVVPPASITEIAARYRSSLRSTFWEADTQRNGTWINGNAGPSMIASRHAFSKCGAGRRRILAHILSAARRKAVPASANHTAKAKSRSADIKSAWNSKATKAVTTTQS